MIEATPAGRLPLTCSAQCKRLRRNQLGRGYYDARLKREHKERTQGSFYTGQFRCSVEGCNKKYYAKGMCNMHYARVWRAGQTSIRQALRLTGCAESTHMDGVTPETEARLRAASPTERRKAIIDAHNEGASNRQIGAVVGMSEAGVRRILNNVKENPS